MPWKDAEKRRAWQREYRKRPDAKAKAEAYRKNPDGAFQRWFKDNEEYRKTYRKRREKEHHEKVRAAKRRWNDANRERINATQRAYRARNRERIQQQFKEWMQKHVEHFAELKIGKAPRRAALLQKWKLCGETCYICGLHLDRVGMEMDHVLPRAHNGTNDIENLMPTHRVCNRRKNKKHDYPIARPDLVELARSVTSAPRTRRATVEAVGRGR